MPGGFNNDAVTRGVPKGETELVIIPQYYNPKLQRFMFSLEYPWQLKGIMPQAGDSHAVCRRVLADTTSCSCVDLTPRGHASRAEYERAITALNNSVMSAKQRRMNMWCFFCGGCCALCCRPGVWRVTGARASPCQRRPHDLCGGERCGCACSDAYMLAKETVFEPRGLGLRGPRTASVPLVSVPSNSVCACGLLLTRPT